VFVKPKEGLKVRRPTAPYAPLPPEGAEVPDSEIHWHRRIADGDVIVVPNPEAAQAAIIQPAPPADPKTPKPSKGGAQ
jgi:hypothetical protein